MRASRQTELEKTFSSHVVCSWIGNTEKEAKESWLLVTEDDFTRATMEIVSQRELVEPPQFRAKLCTKSHAREVKSVLNSSPQRARSKHANRDKDQGKHRGNPAFRQLLVDAGSGG